VVELAAAGVVALMIGRAAMLVTPRERASKIDVKIIERMKIRKDVSCQRDERKEKAPGPRKKEKGRKGDLRKSPAGRDGECRLHGLYMTYYRNGYGNACI